MADPVKGSDVVEYKHPKEGTQQIKVRDVARKAEGLRRNGWSPAKSDAKVVAQIEKQIEKSQQ